MDTLVDSAFWLIWTWLKFTWQITYLIDTMISRVHARTHTHRVMRLLGCMAIDLYLLKICSVFHAGYAKLHFHEQYIWVTISPHPCQYLFPLLMMIAILTGVWCVNDITYLHLCDDYWFGTFLPCLSVIYNSFCKHQAKQRYPIALSLQNSDVSNMGLF